MAKYGIWVTKLSPTSTSATENQVPTAWQHESLHILTDFSDKPRQWSRHVSDNTEISTTFAKRKILDDDNQEMEQRRSAAADAQDVRTQGQKLSRRTQWIFALTQEDRQRSKKSWETAQSWLVTNRTNMLLQNLVALLDKHDAALLDLNKSELQTLTTTPSTMSTGC